MIKKTKTELIGKKIKEESKYINFIFLLLSIYIFFGYLFADYLSYSILVIVTVGIFMYILVNNRKITYNSALISILIIVFILINILPARYSMFPDTSIKVGLSRSVILVIGLLLCIQGISYEKGIKYLLYSSMIHSFFTLFSYFFPNIFSNNILTLLPVDIRYESLKFSSYNLYSGITNQIGINSVYMSIGIAIMYSHLLSNKNNNTLIKKIILIILCITLLLTGKRGSLVASIIAALIISFIDAKLKGKSGFLKVIRNIGILIVLIVFLIYILPEAAAPFKRFLDRIDGDMTSGRTALYKNALDLFKEKPLLGWGAGVFSNLYGTGVHSLYIQLLAEHGVIGFITFITIIIINIIIVMKALVIISKLKLNDYQEYLFFSLFIQIYFIIYGFVENAINYGFVLVTYMIAVAIPCTLSIKPSNRTELNNNSINIEKGD